MIVHIREYNLWTQAIIFKMFTQRYNGLEKYSKIILKNVFYV